MNSKNTANLFIALIYLVSYSVCAQPNKDVQKAVVQIFVEEIVPDYTYPWQIDSIKSVSGSGVIIEGNLIMTAAHIVDNSLSIHVRKTGSDKRYNANIKYISDASDLAIITIDDKDFFTNTSLLLLGQTPNIGNEVTTWGFPLGGSQLTITKGIISRFDFNNYTHSGIHNIVGQIDAAINSGVSGGPAVVNEKLAGIAFQSLEEEGASNIGYIIPLPVINQFLEDISDEKVDGAPSVAIETQSMINPQMRKAHLMSEGMSGLLITKSSHGLEESQDYLKTGDVLLEIDGLSVGNDGTVTFMTGDRINFRYLFKRKQIGSSISIRLLRNGEELTLNHLLKYNSYQSRIVTRHYSGFRPDYEIVGGLVFQELSRDYILSGLEEDEYPSWIWPIYNDYKEKGLSEKEKAVFIATILPDEINIDYADYEDKRVKSINGITIKNLDELRQSIKNNKADFHVIEFEKPAGKIILNKQLEKEKREYFIKLI